MSEHFPPFAAAFIVAALHSLLPSHWLCFVVIGRARGWPLRRALATTCLAGLLHALSTFGLGVALLLARARLEKPLEGYVEAIASGLLGAIGLVYLALHALGAGHRHERDQVVADRMAFGTLLLSMTLSPCVPAGVILLYLSHPEALVVGLLGLLLIGATVGVMALMVSVSWAGAEAIRLKFADRYENLIIGLTLCGLGALSYGVHLLAE
jgi:hypothetical protein